MSTFTSTLPDDLLKQLNEVAQNLSMPKNKLIEKTLRIYLDQLNRVEYVKSYKQMAREIMVANKKSLPFGQAFFIQF